MKPAAFAFERPATLAEATKLLGASDDARVVAGGQSLGPMLNLRLAQPRLLVDVTGIPELTRVEDDADAVTLGACVTTANIEDGRYPARGLAALAAVAAGIAYRAVRNRGTIGGSVCHADPSGDWVPALCALDAQCLIAGPAGRRTVAVDAFVVGPYANTLAPGELLEAIRIPRLAAGSRFGHSKICRKPGEFALAIAAVLSDPGRDRLRVVIGATPARAIVVADGRELRRADLTGIEPASVLRLLDAHGITAPAARRQLVTAVARAFEQARP